MLWVFGVLKAWSGWQNDEIEREGQWRKGDKQRGKR